MRSLRAQGAGRPHEAFTAPNSAPHTPAVATAHLVVVLCLLIAEPLSRRGVSHAVGLPDRFRRAENGRPRWQLRPGKPLRSRPFDHGACPDRTGDLRLCKAVDGRPWAPGHPETAWQSQTAPVDARPFYGVLCQRRATDVPQHPADAGLGPSGHLDSGRRGRQAFDVTPELPGALVHPPRRRRSRRERTKRSPNRTLSDAVAVVTNAATSPVPSGYPVGSRAFVDLAGPERSLRTLGRGCSAGRPRAQLPPAPGYRAARRPLPSSRR